MAREVSVKTTTVLSPAAVQATPQSAAPVRSSATITIEGLISPDQYIFFPIGGSAGDKELPVTRHRCGWPATRNYRDLLHGKTAINLLASFSRQNDAARKATA
jgi:hypothetical protein